MSRFICMEYARTIPTHDTNYHESSHISYIYGLNVKDAERVLNWHMTNLVAVMMNPFH